MDSNHVSTAFYRTDDPLENFKIKVIVREISSRSRSSSTRDNDTIQYFEKESVISWQEKISGPRYVYHYHSSVLD